MRRWLYRIVDADPGLSAAASLAVADVDLDGNSEILIGGTHSLLAYRLEEAERALIAHATGRFVVGLAAVDVDGDGRAEVVAGKVRDDGGYEVALYWPTADHGSPDHSSPEDGLLWKETFVDPELFGVAHDIIPVDIDKDGKPELLVNSAYSNSPGLFIYKPGPDPRRPWTRHTVCTGIDAEGISIGDLDGDGQLEIVHGGDWFDNTDGTPVGGNWVRRTYAPHFREMCRTCLVDVTGDGSPDIVAVESEYLEGKASWFENQSRTNADEPWVEHPFDTRFVYGHSLDAYRRDGEVIVLLGEMGAGGWGQPMNHDARLMLFTTNDNGKSWHAELVSSGTGTHQARLMKGENGAPPAIVGKEWGMRFGTARLQTWTAEPAPGRKFPEFRHTFVDRDKPAPALDIVVADVAGTGKSDILCGSFWYSSAEKWRRHAIPGGFEVIGKLDVDGDGHEEIVATKRSVDFGDRAVGHDAFYRSLTADLYWLKAVNAGVGAWESHYIGSGMGDWPHGVCVLDGVAGSPSSLVVTYHSANRMADHYPEVFCPTDDIEAPWEKRILFPIVYGEQLVSADLTGNGEPDIAGGSFWLENNGDGSFEHHELLSGFRAARTCAADVNGDGAIDLVTGEERLDFEQRVTPYSRLLWYENPGRNQQSQSWSAHVIDRVRCPHSVAAVDIDGDGEVEVVCGEHDPFAPYRSRCRLMVYKRADIDCRSWYRHVVDDRFEHHTGTRIMRVDSETVGIVSHGWTDSRYLNLWTVHP